MTKVTDINSAKNPEARLAGVNFTYSDCNSRLLHGAMEKLDNYTGFSVTDLSRFNKIKSGFDSKSKEVRRLFTKLVDKHSHKEPIRRKNKETGEMEDVVGGDGKVKLQPKMVPNPGGRGMDFDYKDRRAFNVELRELMRMTFKIEAYRLLTEDLVKAGLTPKEIRACGKILSDIDPELVKDTPVFDEEDLEDDGNDDELLDDDDQPAPPLAASSVDQAPEAPTPTEEPAAPRSY